MCSSLTRLTLSLAALPLALTACTADYQVDEEYGSTEGFTPTLLGDFMLDAEGLPGYDMSLDQSREPCLEYTDDNEGQPVFVGNSDHEASFSYIDSRDTLNNELGLSAGLVAKAVASPISGNAKLDFKNNYQSSSNKVYFLIKSTVNYEVLNRRGKELKPKIRNILNAAQPLDGSTWRGRDTAQGDEAEALARNKGLALQFINKCGTDYVHGLKYEAGLYALVSFSTENTSSTTGVDFSAAASGTVGGVAELNGNLGVANDRTRTSGRVKMDVAIETYGFPPPDSLIAAAKEADANHLIERLEAIETVMRNWNEWEKCKDSYDSTSKNCTRPAFGVQKEETFATEGYLRSTRDARAVEVYTKDYFKLQPTPEISTFVNEFAAQSKMVMDECLASYEDMAFNIYRRAAEYQAAGNGHNSHHLDDSRHAYSYTHDDLKDTAEMQMALFAPNKASTFVDGERVLSHTAAIQNYMARCATDADSSDYRYCLQVAGILTGEIDDGGEYRAHLEAAAATAPIVPLRYDAKDRLMTFAAAEEECNYRDGLPADIRDMMEADPTLAPYYAGYTEQIKIGWRLPNADEVDRLSVAFLESPYLPKDGDDEAWAADVPAERLLWFQDTRVCPDSANTPGGVAYNAGGAGVAIVDVLTGEVTRGCIEYREWDSKVLLVFNSKKNNLEHGAQAKVLCVPESGPYHERDLSELR
jgi:hypothetical protein